MVFTARPILDIDRGCQLTADLQTGDHGRLKARTRGIDGRRIARRPAAEDDEAMMPNFIISGLGKPKERVQLAGSVERREIVEAAHMVAPYEDLGHGASAGPLDHFSLAGGILGHIDFGEGHALRLQQGLRLRAETAIIFCVDNHFVHETNLLVKGFKTPRPTLAGDRGVCGS